MTRSRSLSKQRSDPADRWPRAQGGGWPTANGSYLVQLRASFFALRELGLRYARRAMLVPTVPSALRVVSIFYPLSLWLGGDLLSTKALTQAEAARINANLVHSNAKFGRRMWRLEARRLTKELLSQGSRPVFGLVDTSTLKFRDDHVSKVSDAHREHGEHH